LQAAARQSAWGFAPTARASTLSPTWPAAPAAASPRLAYTARAMLRQMGYAQPDVVGLLMLPPLDRHRTRVMPLGNPLPALTELSYYSRQRLFSGQNHEREAPIPQTPDPPFSRLLLAAVARTRPTKTATRELIDAGGQYLYRDLCSRWARRDLGRAGLPAPPCSRAACFTTPSVSNNPVLAAARLAARRRPPAVPALAAALDEQGQANRCATPCQTCVQERGAQQGLGVEPMNIERFRDACQNLLGKAPERRLLGDRRAAGATLSIGAGRRRKNPRRPRTFPRRT